VHSLRRYLTVSLLILLMIGLAAWPVFVVVNLSLSFFLGEGSVIDLWNQEPKRLLINAFIQGYIASATFAAMLGVLAAIDYLVLTRFKLTGYFAGISIPIYCVALAYLYYKSPEQVILNFAITGLVLWVWYKTIDIGFRLRRSS